MCPAAENMHNTGYCVFFLCFYQFHPISGECLPAYICAAGRIFYNREPETGLRPHAFCDIKKPVHCTTNILRSQRAAFLSWRGFYWQIAGILSIFYGMRNCNEFTDP